jgi:hypothetical protein
VDFSESTPVDHPDVLQLGTRIQDRVTVVRHFVEEAESAVTKAFLNGPQSFQFPVSAILLCGTNSEMGSLGVLVRPGSCNGSRICEFVVIVTRTPKEMYTPFILLEAVYIKSLIPLHLAEPNLQLSSRQCSMIKGRLLLPDRLELDIILPNQLCERNPQFHHRKSTISPETPSEARFPNTIPLAI